MSSAKEYNFRGQVSLKLSGEGAQVRVYGEHQSPYLFESKGSAFKFAREVASFYEEMPRIYVECPECQTEFTERELGELAVDIEEDTLGYDLLSFHCPECGQLVKSHRRSQGR